VKTVKPPMTAIDAGRGEPRSIFKGKTGPTRKALARKSLRGGEQRVSEAGASSILRKQRANPSLQSKKLMALETQKNSRASWGKEEFDKKKNGEKRNHRGSQNCRAFLNAPY